MLQKEKGFLLNYGGFGMKRKAKKLNLKRSELERLYEMLPIGKQNAITRAELSRLWGLSDRAARLVISELRRIDFGDKFVIVSFSDGKGYYKTADLEEIEAFANEMRSRALNILVPLNKANRLISQAGSQTFDFG